MPGQVLPCKNVFTISTRREEIVNTFQAVITALLWLRSPSKLKWRITNHSPMHAAGTGFQACNGFASG